MDPVLESYKEHWLPTQKTVMVKTVQYG